MAVAVIGVGVEVLLQTLGFWHYPSADQPYGPPLMYPLIVVMWTVLALFGWRVMRRFGWRGLMVFLITVTVLGTLRDYFIAGQAMGFIVLAPGPLTVLVDAACWAGTTALAQAVMWVIAGPAGADPLVRRPWESRLNLEYSTIWAWPLPEHLIIIFSSPSVIGPMGPWCGPCRRMARSLMS